MKQPLRMKTYFSSTVEAAVALARHELGPEAMLMNSRPAPPDAQHLGRYQVVFATDEQAPESFHALLQDNAVDTKLIDDLLNESPANYTQLVSRMQSRISTSADLGDTVALIGPPGRGKTSTLLKLAVNRGLTLRRPVRILSGDNRRFGSFAATMGLEFHCFEKAAELDRALDNAPKQSLTLIDTSHHTPRNIQAERDLARCLVSRAIDTHLVLRSDAAAGGMLRMAGRYRIFEPARLIFTGLDEVETFGNLFSVAAQTKMPVSFLCAGQRIPEDLEAATTARLVELVLSRARSLERAA
jgi:flagellar biosynthesis GTPase FlhF